MDLRLQVFELVGVLARERYRAAEQNFGRIGLNHTEARLLRLLEQHSGAASQEELSASLQVDRSNAGRAMSSLELAGHISRRVDTADRRRRLVTLTASGRHVLREISKLRTQMAGDFTAALSEAETAELARLLARVVHDAAR